MNSIEIITGVVSNFFWAVIGFCVFGILRYLKQFNSTSYWLGSEGRDSVDIIIGIPFYWDTRSQTVSNDDGLPLFGWGPLQSILSLQRHLLSTSVTKQIRVLTDDQVETNAPKGAFVTIGYPDSNTLSETVIRYTKTAWSFDGHKIIGRDKNKTVIVEPEYLPDGSVLVDYAYICLGPSPFNSDARFTLLAGAETYGVKAAEKFLYKEKVFVVSRSIKTGRIADILAGFWFLMNTPPTKTFEFIVRADIKQHEVSNISLFKIAIDGTVV